MRSISLPFAVLLVCVAACRAGDPQENPPSQRPTPEIVVEREGDRPVSELPGTPPASATEPAPEKPTPQGNVTIEMPREGSSLSTNPLRLSGTARTFENNVAIRILDENERLLEETFATATGELGNFNPWAGEVLLTRMPGRQITIQAFEYSAKDGSVQSLTAVKAKTAFRPVEVTLYFPRRAAEDCSEVFPVTRRVPASLSLLRLVIEALLDGPTPNEQTAGFTSPFPRGAEVRAVNLDDGVATIDFNERLGNVGGSCRALAIRSMVDRTAMELENVSRVRITANGDEAAALQP